MAKLPNFSSVLSITSLLIISWLCDVESYTPAPTAASSSRLFRRYYYDKFRLRSSVSTVTPSLPPVERKMLSSEDSSSPLIEKVDAVVCGGGPAGLLTAIMLAKRMGNGENKIRLYDRLPAPPDADDVEMWKNEIAKFYLIGLGGRGQEALRAVDGVWESTVEPRCVPVVGRKDWQPNGQAVERLFDTKTRPYTTQVLPRDKLVGCLHRCILDNYADQIELKYGYEVTPTDFDHDSGVLLNVASCRTEDRLNPSSVKTASEDPENETICDVEGDVRQVAVGVLVAADGTVRTVANAMEKNDKVRFEKMNPLRRLVAGKPFRVKRYEDDNQRVYKTIPMKLPSSWRSDLNYSARSKRMTIDALPANSEGDYCAALLLKKDDPLAQANTDPTELRKVLKESFPELAAVMDDNALDAVAKKPVSYLPSFRYAGPRLNEGERCVLLGDCAHTVKPYFGLGANSALEDVRIFGELLDEHQGDAKKAIDAFSQRQAAESKAMVRLSRDLDRPGNLGKITFLIPIILDSIFSSALPKIFQPNVISMLQRTDLSFTQVARRKRIDRMMQIGVIGGFLSGVGWSTQRVIKSLAAAVGVDSWMVGAGFGGAVAAGIGARAMGTRNSDGVDPAPGDVIARIEKEKMAKKR